MLCVGWFFFFFQCFYLERMSKFYLHLKYGQLYTLTHFYVYLSFPDLACSSFGEKLC